MFVCLYNWQLTSPFSKAKTPSVSRRPSTPLPERDSSGRSASPVQSWGRSFPGLRPELFRFKERPQTSVCCSSSCELSTPAFRHAALFFQRLSDVPRLQHPRGVSPRIFFRGADWACDTHHVLLDLWLCKICIPAQCSNMWLENLFDLLLCFKEVVKRNSFTVLAS